MPQTLALRLRAVRKSWTTTLARNRRLEKRPALIEQNDAWLAGEPRCAIRGCVCDKEAHGPLQPWIVLQILDIEVEPWIVQFDGCRPVEEPRIRPLIHPGPQFGRGHLGHRVDLLVAVSVLPVRQLRRQIAKQWNRIRGLGTATLVG